MSKILFALSILVTASAVAQEPVKLECTVLTIHPQTYVPETVSCNDGKIYRILEDGSLQEIKK